MVRNVGLYMDRIIIVTGTSWRAASVVLESREPVPTSYEVGV